MRLCNFFIVIFFGLISLPSSAAGGFIVQKALVTKVSATSQNQEAFWVFYSGGTSDSCNGKAKFRREHAGTDGVFDRAFTLATSALVSGNSISIYSYTDSSDCESAVSVDLHT